MVKEFNLSEKEEDMEFELRRYKVYQKKYIKEFIKIIKKKTGKMWWRRILHPLLDKFAGENFK